MCVACVAYLDGVTIHAVSLRQVEVGYGVGLVLSLLAQNAAMQRY